MFAAFVGVFHVKYPRKICVIFLITLRIKNDVGDDAAQNKYVVIMTPTPAKPLNIIKKQNKSGAFIE